MSCCEIGIGWCAPEQLGGPQPESDADWDDLNEEVEGPPQIHRGEGGEEGMGLEGEEEGQRGWPLTCRWSEIPAALQGSD